MEKLKVFRTATSPYQGQNFREKEAELLSNLNIEYLENPDSATILITNTHTTLSDYDLSKIELIIHPNSGYDNFTLEDLSQLKAPIVIGHSIRANAVASYTMSAILSHLVQIPNQPKWSPDRIWKRKDLSKLTVQLIGDGHIGGKIKKGLIPLVKKVNCYDPHKGLHNLCLSSADIVIFAAGLNPTSFHLLNETNIKELKPDVLIINGARGKLIQQDSLVDFLRENKNAFAYLDVFESEPVDTDQYNLSNLHSTSHIAGVFEDLNQEIMNFSYSVLDDYINNKTQFEKKYQNEILQNKVINGVMI